MYIYMCVCVCVLSSGEVAEGAAYAAQLFVHAAIASVRAQISQMAWQQRSARTTSGPRAQQGRSAKKQMELEVAQCNAQTPKICKQP